MPIHSFNYLITNQSRKIKEMAHVLESMQYFNTRKTAKFKITLNGCPVQNEMISSMLSSLIKDNVHSQIMF